MPSTHTRLLGAGIATSLGTGVTAQLHGLRQPPTAPQLIHRQIGPHSETLPYKLLADFPLENLDTRIYRIIDSVVEQALAEAGLTPAQQQRVALFLASSSFDISVSENAYRQGLQTGQRVLPMAHSSSFGNLACRVRERFGFQGEEFSFNTACTASANAAWYAARLIDSGRIDHALVLGVELINDITALGFKGLDLLTRSVMKPFDASRDGLVLGEACTALMLGRDDAAGFRLIGGGNLCDTGSMSAANTDGSTVAAVIQQALAAAGLSASDIRAIKAHGTASLLNDEAEAAGILRAFDALPPITALKPFIGHTLGACGVTELVLLWRALEAGFLPATPGIAADEGALGLCLNQQEIPPQTGPVLLNYFGFGGNNTALILAGD